MHIFLFWNSLETAAHYESDIYTYIITHVWHNVNIVNKT